MIKTVVHTARDALFARERFGFSEGLRTPFRGLVFLAARPRLLALCVAPWAINLLVVLPVVAFVMGYLVYPWLSGMLPEFESRWISWLGFLGKYMIALALIAVSAGLFLLGAIVIGAPFHDLIGERIERELLADRPDLLARGMEFWPGVRHAIFEALRRVGVTIPRILLSLLLGLIPGVGALLVLVFNLYVAAMFLALDAFSMPMDRRGVPLKEKMDWLKANRRFAIGFALPMLAVPCAFFLMPPLASAAGTLMYCRYQLETGESESPEILPAGD